MVESMRPSVPAEGQNIWSPVVIEGHRKRGLFNEGFAYIMTKAKN